VYIRVIFFVGVNWETLPQKKLKAPYIPDKTKAHCSPDHEFEEVFGSPPKRDKNIKLSAEQQQEFEGWEWELNSPVPLFPPRHTTTATTTTTTSSKFSFTSFDNKPTLLGNRDSIGRKSF